MPPPVRPRRATLAALGAGALSAASAVAPRAGVAAGPSAASGAPAAPRGAPPTPDAAPAPGARPPPRERRGLAYAIASRRDADALSPGVAWWYNWSPFPGEAMADERRMAFVPMLWNGEFDASRVETFLRATPSIRHVLVLNEPNLVDQANHPPSRAAAIWPRYEAIAARTGVAIVGPAITWGTLPGWEDPVAWMDAFIGAYRAANGGRAPRIDALAFHWYDYGLDAQLDRLAKYRKPFWVTEMANWHAGDGPRILSPDAQRAQMTDMVATCERRADVHRYAWFTGRWSPDPHHTSVLAGDGELTALGRHYLALPRTARRAG